MIYTYNPTADADIMSAYPTQNDDLDILDVRSHLNDNFRSLLRFDFSANIAATDNIYQAKLSLCFANTPSWSRTYHILRLTETDWVESQVTWDIRNTGANWTNAGGTFDSSIVSSVSFSARTVGSFLNIDITAGVQYAIQNTGRIANWIIMDSVENNATGAESQFYSKDQVNYPKPSLTINAFKGFNEVINLSSPIIDKVSLNSSLL